MQVRRLIATVDLQTDEGPISVQADVKLAHEGRESDTLHKMAVSMLCRILREKLETVMCSEGEA